MLTRGISKRAQLTANRCVAIKSTINLISDLAINWVPKSTVAGVRNNPPAGAVEYESAGYVGRLTMNGGLWIGRTAPNWNRFFIALTDGTPHDTTTSFEVSMLCLMQHICNHTISPKNNQSPSHIMIQYPCCQSM